MNHKVGFRFHPTDEELINHYLKQKAIGSLSEDDQPIAEVNVLKYEPWDLPEFSAIKSNDPYWYFFYQLDKYLNSKRANRRTHAGFWKGTGDGCKVTSSVTKQIIGSKKILVFHERSVSKKSKSHKTDWVMHEYHYPATADFPNPNAYVICCLRKGTNGKAGNQKKRKTTGKAGTNGKAGNQKKRKTTGKAGIVPILSDVSEVTNGNTSTSAHVEGESRHQSPFDFANHVAAHVDCESSHQSPFDFANHVADNAIPEGEGAYLVDQLYNQQGLSYQDLPLSNGFSSNSLSQAELEAITGYLELLSQLYSGQAYLKAVFELLSQFYAVQGPSYQGFSNDALSQANQETIIGCFELWSQLYPEQGLSYQDLSLSNGFSPYCNVVQTPFGNIELEEDFSLLDSNLINEPSEAYPVETISHKNLVVEGEGLDWGAVGMSAAILPLESISEISSIENGGMSSDANNEVAIAQATEHATAIDLSSTTNLRIDSSRH